MPVTHITNEETISKVHLPETAITFIDGITTGVISTINAPGFGTIDPASYVLVDVTGRSTLSIQTNSTWTVATGGLYPQVSIDGVNWLDLYQTYPLLDVFDMDYDSYIYSGQKSIWQIDVTGYSLFRLVAVGTTLTGTISVAFRTTAFTKTNNNKTRCSI